MDKLTQRKCANMDLNKNKQEEGGGNAMKTAKQ